MRHLVTPNRHLFERLFWVASLVIAAGGAAALISGTWHRFTAHPTVISIEKDFRAWNTSFPAVTICFHNKFDENKAKYVIFREWGVNETSEKYNYYLKFLSAISNLSYLTLDKLNIFYNDSNLLDKNLRQLALDVNFDLNCKIVIFDPKSQLEFKPVFLEMGICFTYGSVLTKLLTTSLSTSGFDDSNNLLQCNYLNSLCYGRVENLERDIEYYIHSPNEVPSLGSRSFNVRSREERDTTFGTLTIYSSDELIHLNARQRRCLYPYEGQDFGVAGLYSFGLCEMRCRANLVLRLCGCVPHFYPYTIPGADRSCKLEKFLCIIQHAGRINSNATACQCMPQCDSTSYHLDKDSVQVWKPPIPVNIRFRWAIEKYSKTRLRRDVIFGLNDLLVSFGGTAGLFLGCSLLTGAELIYYILLYMPEKCIYFLKNKLKKNKLQKKKMEILLEYITKEYKTQK